jgi:uncharacterized membrane protein
MRIGAGVRGGLLAVLLLAAAGGGSARAEEVPSPWSLAFYKMLSYEVAVTGYDLVLYRALAGAAAAPAGTFVAATLAVDGGLYYAHELAWSWLKPVPAETTAALEVELAKTLSFRAVSTAGHALVFYALAGDPLSALGFAAAAGAGEAAIYFANEWGWRVLGPGAAPAAPAAAP